MNKNIRGLVKAIAFGGDGVVEVTNYHDQNSDQNSLSGKKGFVPFTIPDEVIDFEIVSSKDNYFNGTVSNLINRSPFRIESACEYFTKCGGCQLQHIDYQEQVRIKLEIIKGAITSGGHNKDVLSLIKKIVQSKPYNYRARILLHLTRRGIGYYERNTHTPVPIMHCNLSDDLIGSRLQLVQEKAHLLKFIEGTLSLECDESKTIGIIKSIENLSHEQIDHAEKFLKEVFQAGIVFAKGKLLTQFGDPKLNLPLPDRFKSLSLNFPGGSFSQVNTGVNKELINRVSEIVQEKSCLTVEDLYSGAGNFTLPVAYLGAKVKGVESNPALTGLGDQRARELGLNDRAIFFNFSVEKYLKFREQKNIDLIIADPPRPGLGNLAKKLDYAKYMILISCHLPSFVRDTKNLIDSGWKIESIEPFDMFPQTSYIEILTVLRRAES